MALDMPRKRGYMLALGVLAVLYYWMCLGRPYHLPSHLFWNSYSNTVDASQDALLDLLAVEPFDPTAIQNVCAEKQWTQGLVFTCNYSFGGIGNIRNSVLHCIRYAIEAGASLVMPTIVLRNDDDISKISEYEKPRAGLDFMFDVQYFIDSLHISCPHLQLYNTIEDVLNHNITHIPLLPEELVENIPPEGLTHPEQWRDTFVTWLKQYGTPTVEGPIIIDLKRSYMRWPIYHDGISFAHNFGRILRIRRDINALALATLNQLSGKYAIPLKFSAPIFPAAFFGVHLRTEIDAVKGWPPEDPLWTMGRFEVQSRLYLEQASHSHTSVIYLASGNLTEVEKFASDAGPKYTITTKSELLSGNDLESLNALAWDQQALVDFLVLHRATNFAGVAHSSFAWNIAIWRHKYSKVSDYLDGPQMLSDEFSQIYGKPRGYPEYARCLWP